jgi:hypothetical protein
MPRERQSHEQQLKDPKEKSMEGGPVTEHGMRLPEVNPAGRFTTSIINKANGLKYTIIQVLG